MAKKSKKMVKAGKKMGKRLAQEVKEGKKADKIGEVMKEYSEGKLHVGSKKGPKAKNKKQALAIAFSEAARLKKKPSKKKK